LFVIFHKVTTPGSVTNLYLLYIAISIKTIKKNKNKKIRIPLGVQKLQKINLICFPKAQQLSNKHQTLVPRPERKVSCKLHK
jgi:hypothetical protein